MVMILNKRIKRVIALNKAQYIGLIFLVALSISLYTIFSSLAFNFNKATSDYSRTTNIEDAKFLTLKDLDINYIENTFNVEIEKRHEVDVSYKSSTIRLIELTNKINIPLMIEGNLIKEGEIALNPAFAKANNIKIGDFIELEGFKYKVSGYVSIPDYIYPTKSLSDLMADPTKFGVAIITSKDILKYNNLTYFYSIKGDVEKVKKYIDENYKILMWQDIQDNLRYVLAKKKIEQLPQLSVKIPLLFFTLTFILLFILLRRIIKLEIKEIGTLYALGYTKLEIQKHYLFYPLIISIIGSILATLFTITLQKPLTNYYVFYFNIPVQSDVKYKFILYGLLESIIILSLASYTASQTLLKHSPTTLLRGKISKDRLTFLSGLNLEKLKFNQKFKIRESIRGISKILTLIFGIFTASTLLLVGFAAKGSIDALINKTIKNTLNYKYVYYLNQNINKNSINQEGFKIAYFKDKNSNENIIVYGLEENTKSLKLKKGKEEVKVDKIYITNSLYEKLNKKNNIELINLFNNQELELKIDDVVDVYTGNVIYMPLEDLNKIINEERNSINGIFSQQPLNIDSKLILKYESIDETLKSFDIALEPVKYMLVAMGILSFIIALIVVYIVTSLIIEENKYTISMLKVLGYYENEINSLMLSFILLPSVLGYVLSIPFVKGFLNSILKTSLKDINLAIPIEINPIYSLFGFAIIYTVLLVSKYISKKRIFKISMVDILKLQNE
ncbi:ABC transporter permease [Thermobrachium celere]|uniref:ABC transporter permease n=1 Tax=Thermobrachium celere TaxID=53422 RepID=UPI001941BFA0|nr:FtsX-like permease family protein [Thermobrachium celere]GFR36174.1 permease [Thermobrachium celere]